MQAIPEIPPIDERCLPEFCHVLQGARREEAERHDGTVYGILPDFRLAYFNPAWITFAWRNHAPASLFSGQYLGTSVLEVTAKPLRPFYRKLFLLALESRDDTLHPLEVTYQCSSAERYREALMTLYPIGDAEGVLVVNSFVVEAEHEPGKDVSVRGRASDYMDEHGLIHQCAHCRRVQNLAVGQRWDWVPEWVRTIPPQTTHTICNICMAYFYPEWPTTKRA